MDSQDFWITRAAVSPAPGESESDETARLQRDGHVRVTVGPASTEIKWSVFAPSFASLFFAMEWLESSPGPFVLKYFLSGWFEETYFSAREARDRIDQIIAKSDLHLMSRVYVREADPERTHSAVPDTLKHAWDDRDADPAYSIDCVFDEHCDRFTVRRVGEKSAVARLWGENKLAFPVINGGAYDQTVSAAYFDVAQSGRARYDHVYAVMTVPDNSPIWIPYQRVILPKRNRQGLPAVSVVSEMAPVEIKLI